MKRYTMIFDLIFANLEQMQIITNLILDNGYLLFYEESCKSNFILKLLL